MAKVFLLGFLCCLLAVCSNAQKHVYFRLEVEDSGKRYPVRTKDCFLMELGQVIQPVYSEQYRCLDALIRKSVFSLHIRHRNKALIIPDLSRWVLNGQEWVLRLNPLADSVSWLVPYSSASCWSPAWGGIPYTHCGTLYFTTGAYVMYGEEAPLWPINEISKRLFMYESTWVDYFGNPLIVEVDKPEPQRLHNTIYTPNPSSTDIFLGPKPSEYYNLWPGN